MSKMNTASGLYIKKSTHHFTAWTLYSLQLGWNRFIPRRSTGTVFAQRKRVLVDKVLLPAKHRPKCMVIIVRVGIALGLMVIIVRVGIALGSI